MKKLVALILALMLVCAACAALAEPSGTVMLYSSTGEDVILKLKEAFEAKYPDVTLEYYQAGSGKCVTKLSTEFETNAVACDVIWMADPSAQLTWKSQGKLVPYVSEHAANVPEFFKDPDNAFIAGRVVLMGISYSTITSSKEDAPTTFWGLCDEKFQNQIVMTDPSASGTTKAAVFAMVNSEKYGWDYFKKLKEFGCELESSSGNTMNKVAAAAYQVCIGVDYNTRNMEDQGSPIGFHDTTDDIIAVPCPLAIPQGAPNEELAKLFIDFVLDPEGGQKVLANECNMTPVNTLTAMPEGMTNPAIISDIAMPIDWNDLEANGNAMLEEFDKIFK